MPGTSIDRFAVVASSPRAGVGELQRARARFGCYVFLGAAHGCRRARSGLVRDG